MRQKQSSWCVFYCIKLIYHYIEYTKMHGLSNVKNCVVYVYRVSQEEWTKLRESVPYVKLYRYNPKHLYPKLNGYGANGHRKVWASGCPRTVRRPWRYTHPLRMPGNETPLANVTMQWPWRDYASAAACVKCLVTLRTTMTWVRVFL